VDCREAEQAPPQLRQFFAPHAQKTCGATPTGYRLAGKTVPFGTVAIFAGSARANEMQDLMATDKEPTVIKKYANRRLYHTGTSSYVTLEDLAGLVRGGEDFVVYDAKSGEDITRSVLAQIIFDEEAKDGQNLLPIAFLRQLIRFYGDSMQALVPRYLEFSMENLTKEQNQFREQMSKAFGGTAFGGGALDAIQAQTRANMAIFTEAFRMFNPFAAAAKAKEEAAAGAAKGDDLGELKRELNEMRDRLDKLAKTR
jgi:polyhydroxyalkanoate synthesis repressor PhaR